MIHLHRYQKDFIQRIEKDELSVKALHIWHNELLHMMEKKQILLQQHINESYNSLNELYELYNIPKNQRINTINSNDNEQILAQLREEIRNLEQRKSLHIQIQQLLKERKDIFHEYLRWIKFSTYSDRYKYTQLIMKLDTKFQRLSQAININRIELIKLLEYWNTTYSTIYIDYNFTNDDTDNNDILKTLIKENSVCQNDKKYILRYLTERLASGVYVFCFCIYYRIYYIYMVLFYAFFSEQVDLPQLPGVRSDNHTVNRVKTGRKYCRLP